MDDLETAIHSIAELERQNEKLLNHIKLIESDDRSALREVKSQRYYLMENEKLKEQNKIMREALEESMNTLAKLVNPIVLQRNQSLTKSAEALAKCGHPIKTDTK